MYETAVHRGERLSRFFDKCRAIIESRKDRKERKAISSLNDDDSSDNESGMEHQENGVAGNS